jgi:hypothetical protein
MNSCWRLKLKLESGGLRLKFSTAPNSLKPMEALSYLATSVSLMHRASYLHRSDFPLSAPTIC